jgi:hypothetical protein
MSRDTKKTLFSLGLLLVLAVPTRAQPTIVHVYCYLVIGSAILMNGPCTKEMQGDKIYFDGGGQGGKVKGNIQYIDSKGMFEGKIAMQPKSPNMHPASMDLPALIADEAILSGEGDACWSSTSSPQKIILCIAQTPAKLCKHCIPMD